MNEICGGAIIWQSVCSGCCYSMLIPQGPIDLFVGNALSGNEGTYSRHSRTEKACLPFLFSSPGCCTKKPTPECHEPRFELYSPDRSNLSSMYHRNKSMGSKKENDRAMRKEEEEGERKKKRGGKKEEKM